MRRFRSSPNALRGASSCSDLCPLRQYIPELEGVARRRRLRAAGRGTRCYTAALRSGYPCPTAASGPSSVGLGSRLPRREIAGAAVGCLWIDGLLSSLRR